MKFNYTKKCLAVMLIISATAISSCKNDDNDRDYALSNQEFVNRASSSNQFEIAAGALAVNRGVSADVKHYGEHMVADHTTAAVEMKNLANGKGWIVPEALQSKEQQNLNRLTGLNGVDFDREFVNVMVLSHQDAVSLFETAADGYGVPDADLRAMASVKLPVLREHLKDAIALKSKVNP